MDAGLGFGAFAVVALAFGAARAFRYRRQEDRADRRREARAAYKRRNHFHGSLDMEVLKGPPPRPEGQEP